MKKILLLLLISSLPMESIAQSNEENDDVPEITFLKFQHSKFLLLDSDKFPIKKGLKKSEMETTLEGNSTALKHYYHFRTLRTMKHITRGVGLAAIVTGLALVPEYDDLGWSVMTGGVLFMLGVQLPIAISAGSQAGKAVDQHNSLMAKNKEKYTINLGINNGGIGLVINF